MAVPKVSVCLPTYNYAKFVGRAIESVLAQSYTEFELLIFDDASQDETTEVVSRYLADDRVSFVRHHTNRGLFANFNLCADAAVGHYLKYLCADDWLDERFLEQTVRLLERNRSLPFVATANWLVDARGNLIGEQLGAIGTGSVLNAAEVTRSMANRGNVVGMPTNTLIRRDDFVAVGGFDESFAPAADVQLWLKLLAHGDLGWIDDPLCSVRIHDDHSHSYGPDPTESVFLVWERASAMPDVLAGAEVVRNAIDREAAQCVLYALAHLLHLRVLRARGMWRIARDHAGVKRALARFVLDLPGLARDQIARIYARRTGRMVVYGSRTRVGERLPHARRVRIRLKNVD